MLLISPPLFKLHFVSVIGRICFALLFCTYEVRQRAVPEGEDAGAMPCWVSRQ